MNVTGFSSAANSGTAVAQNAARSLIFFMLAGDGVVDASDLNLFVSRGVKGAELIHQFSGNLSDIDRARTAVYNLTVGGEDHGKGYRAGGSGIQCLHQCVDARAAE